MASKLDVIVSSTTTHKDPRRFGHLIRSIMPRSFYPLSQSVGSLYVREAKNASDVEGEILPEEPATWECRVIRNFTEIYAGSVAVDNRDEEHLQFVLKFMPDCILLVEEGILDRLIAAGKLASINLEIIRLNGVLTTAS